MNQILAPAGKEDTYIVEEFYYIEAIIYCSLLTSMVN